ncbi:Gfo/Idh/MocA family oxidoreductase [Nonomuraea composti]|uniref:Gfo/Idh/MocA family protein n=1 Tax=Nonomuraea composti TaxID=2720023 RepID=UPI003204F203
MPDLSFPIRVGIVGAGAIARTSHLPALLARGDAVKVVAVCDLDPGRAKELADAYDIPGRYTESTDVVARENPDLIAVATPPVAHREAVITALGAGAWGWCEKPPTLSLAEYDEITAYEKDGGPTVGHGIHQMDLLLNLLGDWHEVHAVAATLGRRTETEDVSFAIVRFACGAIGSSVNSVMSPRETSCLRFDFTDATAEAEHLYGHDNSHWRWTPAPHVSDTGRIAGWAPDENTTQLAFHPARHAAGRHGSR